MRLAIVIAAFAMTAAGLAGQALAQDVDLMQYADGNSDGKVTLEEFTTFSQQAWMFAAMDADKVKLADVDPMAKGVFAGVTPDADGVVTKAAFMAGVPDRFKAADKNGDGVLSAAELNGYMTPPK